MSRHMPHLDLQPERVEHLHRFEPAVHMQRLQLDRPAKEGRHHLGRLDEHLVRRVRDHLGSGCANHLGRILRMVPVPVRDPKLRQLAPLLRQNRLHFVEDVSRRIDQHRLSALGIGQQVAVGLNRPGRQRVDSHHGGPPMDAFPSIPQP